MAKNRPKPSLDLLKAATEAAGIGLPSPELAIPPTPKDAPDLWQIVVIGTLDVRQHNPLWYRLIESLSDAELEVARKSYTVVGLPLPTFPGDIPMQPGFSQFDVGTFAVIAVQDKWTIQTISESNRNRILEVADVVFKKLNEIYVSAYGINRMFGVNGRSIRVKQFLADTVARAGLAITSQENAEAQISFTSHDANFDTTIQLFPSQFDSHRLNVNYNRHHRIKPTNKGYFDVGQDMRAHAEDDWRSASEYGTRLSDCLARAEDE